MKTLSSVLISLFISAINYTQVPFPQNPDWISTDVSSVSTGGAFADIDKDGWLDFVVANGNDISIQKLVVYYNDGNGTFPATPSWQATDTDYHGHLDVGDVNADGWPDVAVSVYIGTGGFTTPGKVKLYLNNNGTLSSNPDWVSGDLLYTFSCAFGDADGDDGFLDLAISDNSQLGGSGKFKIYLNNNGTLNTTPFWTSAFSGYGSGINLADIDDDNDLDLITGGWWQPMRIYLNTNGTFNTNPEYTSTSTSVVEAIVCGDIDKDATVDYEDIYISTGTKKLFYLSKSPVQDILKVSVGTNILQSNQYCYDTESGWVMLASQPGLGTEIKIKATFSKNLDIGITNWDQNKGNYLFFNTTDPVYSEMEPQKPEQFSLYQNYPNPFNPSTTVTFVIGYSSFVSLKVYDVLGNEVTKLVDEYKPAGYYEIEFSTTSGIRNLGSGIYIYQLLAGSFTQTKKMILLK